MNINEDIRHKRKNLEKWKGYTNKNSYISADRCYILPIWYYINAKTLQNLLISH